MAFPKVIAALGESLLVVQARSEPPLIPKPFKDDDATFLQGPIRVIYTGSKVPFYLSEVGMLASRLIAGRLLNLDVNPHLLPLGNEQLSPIWEKISAKLKESGGFWIPSEHEGFVKELTQIVDGKFKDLGNPPWGLHGHIGPDDISFSIRPNGYPSVRSQPVIKWTYRVQVSLTNSRIDQAAYEQAKEMRRKLGKDPFKSIFMSEYID